MPPNAGANHRKLLGSPCPAGDRDRAGDYDELWSKIPRMDGLTVRKALTTAEAW